MFIARVNGSVVSTRKDDKLESMTMLLIEKLDPVTLKGKGDYLVAIDSVGAGVGEIVLYASGSSARMTDTTSNKPCDCVIMAIVDEYDIAGTTIYQKDIT